MATQKQELEILETGREVTAMATACCASGAGMAKIK